MRPAALALALAAVAALAGCASPFKPNGPVATDRVIIPDEWVFEPREIQVKVGTNVTWENRGDVFHSVTFSDLPFDAQVLENETVSYTFNKTGTFPYVCKYHPGMDGKVVVDS